MMKDAYFIYSVSILAIVGVLVCFKQTSAITIPVGRKKITKAIQRN